jgi:LemA protein
MKKYLKPRFIIILLVIITIPMFFSCSYNKMVTLDEGVKSQWAQVQSVYQRRADLIPNLVSTVKGYAKFEQETLTQVVEARAKATSVNVDASKLDANTFKQFQQAQDGLSSSLGRLMVVVEKYPELKANQNFLELQAQLEGTENRITVERQKFNDVTKQYNAYTKKFPQVMVAKMFGFNEKPYFEATAAAQEAPKVEF